MKEIILNRLPPGDRWMSAVPSESDAMDEVFPTLTDGLEYAFAISGCVEYQINAKEGKVYKIIPDLPKPVEKPKTYSLYGEDY